MSPAERNVLGPTSSTSFSLQFHAIERAILVGGSETNIRSSITAYLSYFPVAPPSLQWLARMMGDKGGLQLKEVAGTRRGYITCQIHIITSRWKETWQQCVHWNADPVAVSSGGGKTISTFSVHQFYSPSLFSLENYCMIITINSGLISHPVNWSEETQWNITKNSQKNEAIWQAWTVSTLCTQPLSAFCSNLGYDARSLHTDVVASTFVFLDAGMDQKPHSSNKARGGVTPWRVLTSRKSFEVLCYKLTDVSEGYTASAFKVEG